MDNAVKILVVEDEMIIGAKLSMQLTALGYEITGILPRGEEVLVHLEENKPDIILLDIKLKGKMDGIETAELIEQNFQIPVIYLTANSDEATFNRAKTTKPAAFISKPYKQVDLQRAIELTIARMAGQEEENIPANEEQPHTFILSDRIFIRHKEKMVKLMIADILYVEAERNYSRIFTTKNEYLLSVTLKKIEEKLPKSLFMRIHRSWLVNLAQVEAVGEDFVMVANREVPVSDDLKGDLLRHMQKL
ncbi:MAG: LytTR family transcriptional regulator DNA-binding domain-containing protein [Bacteroidota bacterium]